MTRYLAGRLLQIVPVLFGISVIVFLLVRLIPGDPATAMLGSRATPELIREARDQLKLNVPLWEQYGYWLKAAFHGDFGISYFYQSSVWTLVIPRVPVTLELIGLASLMALLITFPVATLAASRRDRPVDQMIRLVFTSFLGIPSFWLGVVLALLLGVKVSLFPIAGAGSGFADRLYHLTLPALTIAISIAPLLVRALRSSLIEVVSSDFVVTGRASGLRPRFLLWSYMLRNSLLPLVTVFSINLGWVVGSTVVVEQIFGIPGIGSLLISSISTRDYAIIQLVTLILALFVVFANLLTDVAYALFDPRVELRTA